MKEGRGIERRTLLKGLGTTALSVAAPGLVAALAGCARDEALTEALSGFYADPASAQVVGRAFLRRFPEETDTDTLVQRLAGSQRRHWARLAASDSERLAEEVRARHRADFENERVVRIRGWVLSETEARLCALSVAGPGAG